MPYLCVDGDADRDPDAESRDSMNSGGNSGNNVRSVQNFATALPETPFEADDETLVNVPGPDIGDGNGYHQTMVSRTITGGDAETRPVNAYMNWIIKY